MYYSFHLFGFGVHHEAVQRLTVLPRQHIGHSKHPLPTTQETTLHMMGSTEIRFTVVFQPKKEKLIQSAKTIPEADLVSDHELFIARFRLKLNKVGKTTRPLRYDLNQIPYDYTVEVRNRFKGLNLIDRVPEELLMEVCNNA